MQSGVLATVAVHNPSRCPVSPLSRHSTVTSVSRGRPSDGAVPVEVTTEESVPDATDGDHLFSYDGGSVYRLEGDSGQGCACEQVESYGCPVRNIRAEDGEVVLQFITGDVESLRSVVSTLKERAASVSIRSLRRSNAEDRTEPVYLDRGAFTDRQREVLRAAHEMGYFERPKRANAGDVAAALDISPSTLAEHLAAAQTKLMNALFEGR